ncbi:MAG: class I SAM-dependent methyltransferase [Xanthobacteraceae bacterium]
MTASRSISVSTEEIDSSRNRLNRAIQFVKTHGVGEVFRLVRNIGVRGSLDFAFRNIRHIIADRIARRWDRDHNVDTAGSIQLKFLDVVGPNRDFGNECVCTSPKSFNFIMEQLPADLSRYTFIDIGAGKSRTLLLASHYGFAKVTGVEFAKELVAISRRNIASFQNGQQKCHDLSITEGDAADFAFPEGPLLVYFYNPFSPEIFEKVLQNLITKLKSSRQECHVVYASSSNNTIGWAKPLISKSGYFTELAAKPMPLFWDAVRTIGYAVYRAN